MKPDNDVCFVAMPFRSPYLEHFRRFYRGALDDINMQAVRAWGGLSSEEYCLSLFMLISRSGVMLAEVEHWKPERLQRNWHRAEHCGVYSSYGERLERRCRQTSATYRCACTTIGRSDGK